MKLIKQIEGETYIDEKMLDDEVKKKRILNQGRYEQAKSVITNEENEDRTLLFLVEDQVARKFGFIFEQPTVEAAKRLVLETIKEQDWQDFKLVLIGWRAGEQVVALNPVRFIINRSKKHETE